jgi:hypothetical protein
MYFILGTPITRSDEMRISIQPLKLNTEYNCFSYKR